MMNDLIKATKLLKTEQYTCVLCRDDILHTETNRGVKPLIDLFDSGIDCSGFSAADKVVGNAAAFLYVLLGVKAVYALVVSEAAVSTLKENGVQIQYDTCVKSIINRAGTGNCPMEEAVKGLTNPLEALKAIRIRLSELSPSN